MTPTPVLQIGSSVACVIFNVLVAAIKKGGKDEVNCPSGSLSQCHLNLHSLCDSGHPGVEEVRIYLPYVA